jgi:cation diffusion facilitator family transporter
MHEQSPLPETPLGEDRFRKGRRVTWISIGVNVVLTAIQVLVGVIAHSQSLIADALHTLSDIVSDGFVLYANHKGAEDPDEEHPYGHGRFETAASLVLGLLLAATGAGILIAAAGRLQNLGAAPVVGAAALWAALISLAGKETLFRYMLGVAQQLRSPLLVANAWHARADALSSLVVAVGVGGALAGFSFADAVAAIVVGAMIIKTGFGFALTALRELIDTGLAEDEVARIRTTILTTPGVLDLHELRTRRMGHQALVDAHILVNARISVSEGHMIGESARARVLSGHPDVLDVLVHIDDEDDHAPGIRKVDFPDRATLLQHLRDLLGEDLPALDRTVLHYLSTGLEAEVFLPAEITQDAARVARIEQRLTAHLAGDPWFGQISLNSRIAPK